MLSGHLREKNNTYYAVLNCKHSDGKRYSKWVSTGIAVKKGNKRTAEKKLEEFCSTYDEYGRLPGEVPEVQQNTSLTKVGAISSDILFCDYMLTWLSYVETEVDPVTYSGYCNCVENNVYPYFKETGIKLSELEPAHLREFTGMNERAIQSTDESRKRERRLHTITLPSTQHWNWHLKTK